MDTNQGSTGATGSPPPATDGPNASATPAPAPAAAPSPAPAPTGATGAIELTPGARDKAKEYLAGEKNPKAALRVIADAHGKLALSIDEARAGDATFVADGLSIVAAQALGDLLQGLKVDFVSGGFAFAGTAKALDEGLVKKATQPAAAAHGDHGHGHGDHGHAGAHEKVDYKKIAVILTVLTVVELGVANIPGIGKIPIRLMLIVLAVWKAVLVALFFMHLKFEKKWKYVAIIPALILAAILVFALMPDVARIPEWTNGLAR